MISVVTSFCSLNQQSDDMFRILYREPTDKNNEIAGKKPGTAEEDDDIQRQSDQFQFPPTYAFLVISLSGGFHLRSINFPPQRGVPGKENQRENLPVRPR